MLVRFKTNLGRNDAAPLGLDFTQCTKGAELDVSDKAGEWLVKRGIAEAVPVVKAISPPPEITAPAPLAAKVKQFDKPTHKEA